MDQVRRTEGGPVWLILDSCDPCTPRPQRLRLVQSRSRERKPLGFTRHASGANFQVQQRGASPPVEAPRLIQSTQDAVGSGLSAPVALPCRQADRRSRGWTRSTRNRLSWKRAATLLQHEGMSLLQIADLLHIDGKADTQAHVVRRLIEGVHVDPGIVRVKWLAAQYVHDPEER